MKKRRCCHPVVWKDLQEPTAALCLSLTSSPAALPAMSCLCPAAFSCVKSQSEKLSAKDTRDVPNGHAGPAVSHGNMTAMLSQQSALRWGLCLGPSWGQTPSRLTEAATSRRNDICDCGVFPSLRDCIKTNPKKPGWKTGCRLLQEKGMKTMRCCACGSERGFLQGVNVRLQASVLPCSRLDGLLQPHLVNHLNVNLSL